MNGVSLDGQKVTAGHLHRDAYLYVRQSTLRQVATRPRYAGDSRTLPRPRRKGSNRHDALDGIRRNAFWHFGGAPRRIVLDNLKAAVLQADWFDPECHPKIQEFAAHYGCVFLPTNPRTPRHKRKIEWGVDYVQENALKGRTFRSLNEQNDHLSR